MRAGEVRSGSEKKASKTTAAAPISLRRVVRRATWVRGQGHCPSLARLSSSMSMTRTPASVHSRGCRFWKTSKAFCWTQPVQPKPATYRAATQKSAAAGSRVWERLETDLRFLRTHCEARLAMAGIVPH